VKTVRRISGFTLIEMLVVISILGLIAGLAVPALKNLGKSNATASAGRQLLDGVSRARQLAISQRTTVFMVFVDASFWTNMTPQNPPNGYPAAVTNLCDKQFTGYSFLTLRSVGDQPGQGTTNYWDGWQNLPQGNFIAQWKFFPRASTTTIQDSVDNRNYAIPGFFRTSLNNIPFPFANSGFTVTNLPYVAFNYLGQLTTEQLSPAPYQQDEYIPLDQGSVAVPINGTNKIYILANSPSVLEIPPGNSTNSAYHLIHIDWLTGRAREETEQAQ
jgi:prepilin-type N-terminal cleavage/methylation domain-containing protein